MRTLTIEITIVTKDAPSAPIKFLSKLEQWLENEAGKLGTLADYRIRILQHLTISDFAEPEEMRRQ